MSAAPARDRIARARTMERGTPEEWFETIDMLRAALDAAERENERLRQATPESVAQQFHEAYERLAPSFGYETRKASAVAWADVPEPNRSLMIAVAGEVLAALASAPPAEGAND